MTPGIGCAKSVEAARIISRRRGLGLKCAGDAVACKRTLVNRSKHAVSRDRVKRKRGIAAGQPAVAREPAKAAPARLDRRKPGREARRRESGLDVDRLVQCLQPSARVPRETSRIGDAEMKAGDRSAIGQIGRVPPAIWRGLDHGSMQWWTMVYANPVDRNQSCVAVALDAEMPCEVRPAASRVDQPSRGERGAVLQGCAPAFAAPDGCDIRGPEF